MEPLHDLVNGGAGFQIFEHNRNRHTGIPKHPRAAHFAGDTLHGGALGPVEHCCCHALFSFFIEGYVIEKRQFQPDRARRNPDLVILLGIKGWLVSKNGWTRSDALA
jgi:hypothetical protein